MGRDRPREEAFGDSVQAFGDMRAQRFAGIDLMARDTDILDLLRSVREAV
jgi:hypothetical protein